MAATINILQDRKAALTAHAAAINKKAADEGRAALSVEEQTAFDADMAEIKATTAALKREEEVAALQAELRPVTGTTQSLDTSPKPGKLEDRIDFAILSKPKNFEGPDARKNAFLSGKWLQAELLGNANAKRWISDNAPQMLSTSSGQGEFINAAGSVLIPNPLSATIINLRESYGVFRREVKVMPMGSDNLTMPRRVSGLTSYWVAENNDTTASQKAWDSVTLVAKELATLVRYPMTLDEDAVIAIADDLAGEIAYAFAKEEDTAGFTGDGSAAHGGIVGLANKFKNTTTLTGNFTAATGHTGFSTLTQADISGLMGTLPQYALQSPNCKFYCSALAYANCFQRLAFASSGNWSETITKGVEPTYNGYPIVISQVLNATAGAQTSVYGVLFFGDLSMAAMMGDRKGIAISSSTDRYFEFRQVGIQGVERVDVNVHDVGSTSVAGPIVAMAFPGS